MRHLEKRRGETGGRETGDRDRDREEGFVRVSTFYYIEMLGLACGCLGCK
jgi:hypothetical protein